MVDDLFAALADKHRREILLELLDRGASEKISAAEKLRGPEPEFENLQTELHHNHLPRLEEVGLIRWDTASTEISRGPRYDEIEPILQALKEHGDRLIE